MQGPDLPREPWLVPFLITAVLPFLLIPLPGPSFDPLLTAIGVGLMAGLVATVLLPRSGARSELWLLGSALGYLVVVALLREAGGGNLSGLGPLVVVPVIWCALFTPRRVTAVAVFAVAPVYWVPVLISSEERYPASGWRIGLLFLFLCAFAALAIDALRTQLRERAERLLVLAHIDELTGLANRRRWRDELARTVALAQRSERPISVALIDVDHFKAINDARGHAAGDEVLTKLAAAWRRQIRDGVLLARLGGDEFALLMPDTPLEEASQVLERLRAAVPDTKCSIGGTSWSHDEPIDEMHGRADRLLYEAKAAGRDRLHAAARPVAAAA